MCHEIRKELLGEYIDTKIPEEYERAVSLGLYEKCSVLVGKTARMVAELMLELVLILKGPIGSSLSLRNRDCAVSESRER